MLTVLKNVSLQGIKGVEVSIEVDVNPGMPKFEIVGLPDTALRESKDRIITAIKNSGHDISGKKIIVNLAPAEIRKTGTSFDLSIAIGILNNLKYLKSNEVHNQVYIGELSLNGKLNATSGVLPMCIELKKIGVKKIIVPIGNYEEASLVEGIEVIGTNTLNEVIEYINNGKIKIINEKEHKEHFFEEKQIDFQDVKGQYKAKRAIEIAVAGGHNLLLIGPPGSGKTMLAQRIKTVLPPMNSEEKLEVTKIHSIKGLTKRKLISTRPFIMPHYSITKVALIGGGLESKPRRNKFG